MTREEQDEKDFEELFAKGMYYLKFALVDPKDDIHATVKGWMKEAFLESRRTLREKIASVPRSSFYDGGGPSFE